MAKFSLYWFHGECAREARENQMNGQGLIVVWMPIAHERPASRRQSSWDQPMNIDSQLLTLSTLLSLHLHILVPPVIMESVMYNWRTGGLGRHKVDDCRVAARITLELTDFFFFTCVWSSPEHDSEFLTLSYAKLDKITDAYTTSDSPTEISPLFLSIVLCINPVHSPRVDLDTLQAIWRNKFAQFQRVSSEISPSRISGLSYKSFRQSPCFKSDQVPPCHEAHRPPSEGTLLFEQKHSIPVSQPTLYTCQISMTTRSNCRQISHSLLFVLKLGNETDNYAKCVCMILCHPTIDLNIDVQSESVVTPSGWSGISAYSLI